MPCSGYGGGSALDVAKAAAGLATAGADPLDYLEVVGAGRPIITPGLPCVAVPTTAGTGSEVTRNAVLSGDGVKASLRSPLLLPKLAVVDPDLLVGLPRTDHRRQRHGRALPADRAAAVPARQPVHRRAGPGRHPPLGPIATPGVRSEGMVDAGVRDDLALASLFGGLCLANSGLGAVHGLAAAIGARLSAPHGAVCAAVLAATRRRSICGRCATGRPIIPPCPGSPRWPRCSPTSRTRPPRTPIGWLHALTAALSIPGLASFGLTETDIGDVVTAAQRASSMRGNPITAQRRRGQRDRFSLPLRTSDVRSVGWQAGRRLR